MTKDDLSSIKDRVIIGMKEFKKYSDGAYSSWDIRKVKKILSKYYKEMNLCYNKKTGNYKDIVKNTVLALNELNEKCEYSLIETDQREDICEYIIQTAYTFNFIESDSEDITEEWREW